MAITEASRHQLYKALEEHLGAHTATTLMEHLPLVGWADVATERDLDALDQRLSLRIEAALERGLRHQTQVFVTWMIASNAAMAAAVIAAVKIA